MYSYLNKKSHIILLLILENAEASTQEPLMNIVIVY
jgi:hypothetical protein